MASLSVLGDRATYSNIRKHFSVEDLRKPSLYRKTFVQDMPHDMISRRKILSQSRDNLSQHLTVIDDEEDVWYQKEKLYRDHIEEVLAKWSQIDDEIWAKVICLERNRRVAKAYARTPVLTINGSQDGFDGYRIGLNGFENPMRDTKTDQVKRQIGHGVKIKMDTEGNILVKRISKKGVFIRDMMNTQETSLSTEALQLTNGALEMDKPVKLFDMKKFQTNLARELKRTYPDRKQLQYQCISAIVFVRNETDILDCPSWIMIINIVAMDMLKSKFPSADKLRSLFGILEEHQYSVPTAVSARDWRTTENPPKLPPRDFSLTGYHIPTPDYEMQDDDDYENRLQLPPLLSSRKKANFSFLDDPYYCGFKAHIPNFANSKTMGMQPMNKPNQFRRLSVGAWNAY